VAARSTAGPTRRAPRARKPAWVDLLDPDDDVLLRAIPAGVQPTALERLQAPIEHDDEPRPRLETHGDYIFGVLVVPLAAADREVVFQEIDVVATRDQLLTVRKTPAGGEPFQCDELRAARLEQQDSVGMCLYHLIDEVAEAYLDAIDIFDEGIDELEDRVEDWEPVRIRGRISQLRHDLLRVRRALSPTRDAARAVLDDRVELDGEELFPKEIEIRFADSYDKLLRASDGIDLARDLLAGVRDYLQAQIANDQNEVMKRLTVVASILLVPTFIVGLYGQNLKGVPEFGFKYGYAWSWGVIIVTTVMQLVWFRRKRWI